MDATLRLVRFCLLLLFTSSAVQTRSLGDQRGEVRLGQSVSVIADVIFVATALLMIILVSTGAECCGPERVHPEDEAEVRSPGQEPHPNSTQSYSSQESRPSSASDSVSDK